MSLTKIGSIGINTGIQFAGVTTVSTLHVGSGVTLSSDGDVFATGISTFSEDIKVGSGVTISPDGDIFATGVSTFSGNLKVGSGVTISPDGDGFYTGVVTATTFSGALAASNLTGALPAISGANLTNLDASDLASGTVPTARLGSGTASSSTFLRGDSSFQTITTDLVGDTTPQLGGNLDNNGKNITFGDSAGSSDDRLTFGAGTDLSIYHDDSNSRSRIEHSTDNALEILQGGNAGMLIQNQNSYNIEIKTNAEDAIKCVANGAVELYHNNVKKLETGSGGIKLPSEAGGAQLQVGANNDFAIEHDGSNTYLGNNTGDIVIQNDANVKITAKSGGTQRFRFDSDGLKFGTDTASANALDDYEEGTFTPRLGGTSNSSTYYVTGNGWYRKIGRMVYTCIRMNSVDLDNNASGEVKLHNLPFTCNSAATATDAITTDFATYNVVFNTSHQYAWYASNGGTAWVGLESRNNTSWASWYVSDFHASNLYINFSGWYQTDS